MATSGIVASASDGSVRPEVRQVSAALAHNIALAHFKNGTWRAVQSSDADGWKIAADSDPIASSEEGLHPHVVQILCSSLEGITSEPDDTVRLRRISTAFNVLASSDPAKELCQDLGFADALEALKSDATSRGIDTASSLDKILELFVK